MYLKSVDGKILFEGRFSNVRQGLEMAVEGQCDLTGINLRGANLSGAQMDGAIMPQSCLWGANLNGANMCEGNFAKSDFRTAHLPDTCLSEADCHGVNFEGAYFSRTQLIGTDLTGVQFSCPSIFSVDLAHVASLQGASYSHQGEIECDLSHAPLIIHGLHKPMIFMDDCVLVGQEHRKIALRNAVLSSLLGQEVVKKIIVNQ